MKAGFFHIVLTPALFVIACGIIASTTVTEAQTVVLAPQKFTLVPYDKPFRMESGEKVCTYFFWTKNFSSDQHVAFNWIENGATTGDVPALGNVTIVFDPANNLPVAWMVGFGDYHQKIWELHMSENAHRVYQDCLGGIAVKAP